MKQTKQIGKAGSREGSPRSSQRYQPRDGMSAIADIVKPSRQLESRRKAALCRLL